MGQNAPECNSGDPALISGLVSSPGEGIGYPLQLDVGFQGFPGGSVSKESTCNVGDRGSTPGLKIPWMRSWQLTPIFLPGESPWTEPGGLASMGLHPKSQRQMSNSAHNGPETVQALLKETQIVFGL